MSKLFQQNLKYLVNVVFYILALVLCVFLVPKVIVFFMPFVLGWIISLIANPLVLFFEKKLKIKRKAGTVFVIVLVIAAVIGAGYGIVSILIRQFSGFIAEIPDLWAGVEADFSNLGLLCEKYLNMPAGWSNIINSLGNYIGSVLSDFSIRMEESSFVSVGGIVENVANIIIGIIMTFLSAYFFTADHEELALAYKKHIPESIDNKFELFQKSITLAVGGYFKAQIKIEIWIYFLLLIGLTILGVNYSFLFALLIAVLDFLPVFGTGTVLWPWAILKLLSGDWLRAVGFMVIWGLGQLVRQLIQPKIMGDSIGMEPLPTLLILFIGYKFAGVGGMIIAIPVGIILVNMYEAHWFDSFTISVRMLWNNLHEYRKISDAEVEKLKNNTKSDKKQISDKNINI